MLHGKRVGSEIAPGMLTAVSKPPFDPTQVITGRMPSSRGEIAVNRQLAEREHLQVGSRVGIATRSGVRFAHLVGTIDLRSGTSMGGATIILAQLRDIQEWSQNEGRISLVMATGVSERQPRRSSRTASAAPPARASPCAPVRRRRRTRPTPSTTSSARSCGPCCWRSPAHR